MATVDLLLHPVRLRIVEAFLGDRALTTSALSAELADVPPASLYRHVARLVDAGVLAIVAERRVRGALERTYVLRLSAAAIGLDEVEAMSADDHRHAFMAFVAGLLGDFDRYLARGDIDLLRDGVSYRMAGLWLDDAEHTELLHELTRVLQPRLANLPRPGRKRRILGSVLLPGSEAGPRLGDGTSSHPDDEATSQPGDETVSRSDDEAASGPGGDASSADPPSPNELRRNP